MSSGVSKIYRSGRPRRKTGRDDRQSTDVSQAALTMKRDVLAAQNDLLASSAFIPEARCEDDARDICKQMGAEFVGVEFTRIPSADDLAGIRDEFLRIHGFDSLDDLREILRITGWELKVNNREPHPEVLFRKIDARRKMIRSRYPQGVALFEVFKNWWSGKLGEDFFHWSRTAYETDENEIPTGNTIEVHLEDCQRVFAGWEVSADGFFQRQA